MSPVALTASHALSCSGLEARLFVSRELGAHRYMKLIMQQNLTGRPHSELEERLFIMKKKDISAYPVSDVSVAASSFVLKVSAAVSTTRRKL